MSLQTVTVTLPQTIYHRLVQTARMTNQSLDDVLLQTIRGNIPPLLDDVPAGAQAELRPLLALNDDDLWAVARSEMDSRQWQRHRQLLQKNAAGSLNEQEQEELSHLRSQADLHVLRKSFALALLKWRGYTLPALGTQVNHGST